MSPTEVKEIVARLRAAYPEPQLSDETEKVYTRLLQDLDYAAVDAAVDELIATSMRLPTVSRIRRQVIEPMLDLPTAEEAWVALQSRSTETHSLIRRAAVLMGGSFNIRTSSEPELTRVRFAKVYDEIRRKAVDEAIAAGVRAQRMQLPRAS